MTYSTGNLERDHMLRNAIAAYGNDREAIRAALPNDFDAGDDEISAVLAESEVTFEEELPGRKFDPVPRDPVSGQAVAPRKIVEDFRPLQPAHADESHERAPQTTTSREMTHGEAVAALRAADTHLTECRLTVRRTTTELQVARRNLQLEIEKYLTANPNPLSAESNARAYAMGSLEERRQRVLRGATTGESARARAFVQKRMTGGGPSRGGLSQAQRARLGFVVPGSAAAAAPHDYQADAKARAGLIKPGPAVIPGK